MSNKQSLLTKLYLASFPIIANAWILIVYLKSWLNSNDSRIKERIGITDLRRPEGVVIWCHAVSLGESLAILPLIFQDDRLCFRKFCLKCLQRTKRMF